MLFNLWCDNQFPKAKRPSAIEASSLFFRKIKVAKMTRCTRRSPDNNAAQFEKLRIRDASRQLF